MGKRNESVLERYERLAAEFYRLTGIMAPGKDLPPYMANPDCTDEKRMAAWELFLAEKGEKQPTGGKP